MCRTGAAEKHESAQKEEQFEGRLKINLHGLKSKAWVDIRSVFVWGTFNLSDVRSSQRAALIRLHNVALCKQRTRKDLAADELNAEESRIISPRRTHYETISVKTNVLNNVQWRKSSLEGGGGQKSAKRCRSLKSF